MKKVTIFIICIISYAYAQKPCANIPLVNYGGQAYKTIELGKQCWFKENLNIGEIIQGKEEQTDNKKIEKYCYDNVTSNCKLYGGLYQWGELMHYISTEGTQGICPENWRIPTDKDFAELEMFLGINESDLLKTGNRGTNQSFKLIKKGSYIQATANGFDALYVGNRLEDGTFSDFNVVSYFWTSSAGDSDKLAIARFMITEDGAIYREMQTKTKAFSVRCIKN